MSTPYANPHTAEQLATTSNLSHRRPLLTVETVIAMIDMDRIEVFENCDCGRFAWVFDLSTPGSSRRELRIWRGSVIAWREMDGADPAAKIPEADVLCSIIPPLNPRSSDLARRFGISRDHLRSLICAREIAVASAPTQSQGINATCRLLRNSVLSFLRRRRVGWRNPLAIPVK
jgi:hypothetical protein